MRELDARMGDALGAACCVHRTAGTLADAVAKIGVKPKVAA